MTPAETMLDGIDVLCTDENFKDSSEKYMINVIKEKPDGKADLDKYVQGAVLGLFPKVGSEIFDMGKALSGGWSNVSRKSVSTQLSILSHKPPPGCCYEVLELRGPVQDGQQRGVPRGAAPQAAGAGRHPHLPHTAAPLAF